MIYSWQELSQQIEAEINRQSFSGKPNELYEPIGYTMTLGGKRVRPTLCLLSNQIFGGNTESAMNLAMAVEVFHNFTLVHDDIMDEAPLRRGKEAVHKKWGRDVAILSGDVMMVLANQFLCKANADQLKEILDVFNQTAIEVCEGQQFDMNFENLAEVSSAEYIEMIRLKTAVLLACSLKMGALNSNAPQKEAEAIYRFGEKIGIAFQIQDDYLDCYANPDDFGKRVGGDILCNKKTFLLLAALEHANPSQKVEIEQLLQGNWSEEEKISRMLKVYDELDIHNRAKSAMEEYFQEAIEAMEEISASEELKKPLVDLAKQLMKRKS